MSIWCFHINWSGKYLMRNAWGHIFLTADVGIVAVINLKDCWDFSETLLLLRFWHPFTFYLSLLLSKRNTWDISLWFFFFFSYKATGQTLSSTTCSWCVLNVCELSVCQFASCPFSGKQLVGLILTSIIRSWQSNIWPKEDQTIFHLPSPVSTTAVPSRK